MNQPQNKDLWKRVRTPPHPPAPTTTIRARALCSVFICISALQWAVSLCKKLSPGTHRCMCCTQWGRMTVQPPGDATTGAGVPQTQRQRPIPEVYALGPYAPLPTSCLPFPWLLLPGGRSGLWPLLEGRGRCSGNWVMSGDPGPSWACLPSSTCAPLPF